ncbi:PadR family transcriptional regulator [Streptomyces sp. N2-109]|uniref:PadR family transcriptional regulator n=1 Tax=Streptomyces gossypii TaxID=2883101 RepID=A0ABT2JNQ0_9ACTN|nr:PadR family transcriptional regulator [Streptomyces gossypii]MCT2589000.1 PadR family transcriptional regulator [Streptomyces gossypii]
MLALAVLGFLAERPLHAYELRRRISDLMGHTRPVSDGALYPALNRLREAGHLERHPEPGAGAPTRQVLRLTGHGRAELLRRLREPKQGEISNSASFFTLLAFLSQLPDRAEQAALLQRRLDFLDEPASFFRRAGAGTGAGTSGELVRIKDESDRYRRGMLIMAREAHRAERDWIAQTLAELRGPTGGTAEHPA